MKLTDELIQKSDGMLVVESEINDWTNNAYQMFNDAGVEVETGEFLYGMVRILKPVHILETGTHKGISASYMGKGLYDNGLSARLDTIEHHKPFYDEANKLFASLGLGSYVYAYCSDIDSFHPRGTEYELMFLDSETDRRFKELIRFYPSLKPGGFVFLHDLHRHMGQGQPSNPDHPEISNWPWGDLPQQIKDWVKEDKLRPIHFPTPRGMMGFYKPRDDDYKWR